MRSSVVVVGFVSVLGVVSLGGCANYVSPRTKIAAPSPVVIEALATNGYGLEVNVDENGRVVPEAEADDRTDTVECDLVFNGSQSYWSEEGAEN